MKEFILLTLILLALYGLGFIKSGSIKMEWMDKNYTGALKGLAILTVMWAHGGAFVGVGGVQFIAGTGVALFLILSGYGLEMSYKKNGLRWFISKRIVRIVLPAMLIEVVWEIINHSISLKGIIASASGVYLYNWYIKYIVECYIIFYLVKLIFVKLLKMNFKQEMIAYSVIFISLFIKECIVPLNSAIPVLVARQEFSFMFGIYIANNRKLLEKANTRVKLLPAILLIISCVCMFIGQIPLIKNGNFFFQNIICIPTVLTFAIFVMLIAQKYELIIRNRFLIITGFVSFELFLVQCYAFQGMSIDYRGVVFYVINSFCISFIVYFVIKGLKILIDKIKAGILSNKK